MYARRSLVYVSRMVSVGRHWRTLHCTIRFNRCRPDKKLPPFFKHFKCIIWTKKSYFDWCFTERSRHKNTIRLTQMLNAEDMMGSLYNMVQCNTLLHIYKKNTGKNIDLSLNSWYTTHSCSAIVLISATINCAIARLELHCGNSPANRFQKCATKPIILPSCTTFCHQNATLREYSWRWPE